MEEAVCLAACKKLHEMGVEASLSLKEEHRARDLFYALWVPDLFMKRVNNNGEWSLFCPNEAPGLSDCWGEEFEELYTRYEREECSKRTIKKIALGDQQQGSFSINIWKSAFLDAFQRLCPVQAGGNQCGCLPVLAGMVMEQSVARLDVAMFNAILRESDNEIPTNPVSDPIVDSKVLPILAREGLAHS